MNWFDIIKVLGTKSGYAQLDFDNIVEEDEDNCKKRWQELCDKLRKATKEVHRAHDEGEQYSSKMYEGKKSISVSFGGETLEDFKEIQNNFYYDPDVPEEVYCKALDILKTGGDNKFDKHIIGDYEIRYSNYYNEYQKGHSEYAKGAFQTQKSIRILSKSNDPHRANIGFSILLAPHYAMKFLHDLIVAKFEEALK